MKIQKVKLQEAFGNGAPNWLQSIIAGDAKSAGLSFNGNLDKINLNSAELTPYGGDHPQNLWKDHYYAGGGANGISDYSLWLKAYNAFKKDPVNNPDPGPIPDAYNDNLGSTFVSAKNHGQTLRDKKSYTITNVDPNHNEINFEGNNFIKNLRDLDIDPIRTNYIAAPIPKSENEPYKLVNKNKAVRADLADIDSGIAIYPLTDSRFIPIFYILSRKSDGQVFNLAISPRFKYTGLILNFNPASHPDQILEPEKIYNSDGTIRTSTTLALGGGLRFADLLANAKGFCFIDTQDPANSSTNARALARAASRKAIRDENGNLINTVHQDYPVTSAKRVNAQYDLAKNTRLGMDTYLYPPKQSKNNPNVYNTTGNIKDIITDLNTLKQKVNIFLQKMQEIQAEAEKIRIESEKARLALLPALKSDIITNITLNAEAAAKYCVTRFHNIEDELLWTHDDETRNSWYSITTSGTRGAKAPIDILRDYARNVIRILDILIKNEGKIQLAEKAYNQSVESINTSRIDDMLYLLSLLTFGRNDPDTGELFSSGSIFGEFQAALKTFLDYANTIFEDVTLDEIL